MLCKYVVKQGFFQPSNIHLQSFPVARFSPILVWGQLRSSVSLDSNFKRNTLQIHHIALSANVTFRLTLPCLVRSFALGTLFGWSPPIFSVKI